MKVAPHSLAKAPNVKQPWLIQLGVVLMAFGVGGLIGFLAGRSFAAPPLAPSSPYLTRAELHANNAEYFAHRAIIGASHLERKHR
jgi:hypothetical protein